MHSLPFDVLSLIISSDHFKVGPDFDLPGVDDQTVYNVCLVNEPSSSSVAKYYGDPFRIRHLHFNFSMHYAPTRLKGILRSPTERQGLLSYCQLWLDAAPLATEYTITAGDAPLGRDVDPFDLILELLAGAQYSHRVIILHLDTTYDKPHGFLRRYARTATSGWIRQLQRLPNLRSLDLHLNTSVVDPNLPYTLPLERLSITNHVGYGGDDFLDDEEGFSSATRRITRQDFAGRVLEGCSSSLRHLTLNGLITVPLGRIAFAEKDQFQQLQSLDLSPELRGYVMNMYLLQNFVLRRLPSFLHLAIEFSGKGEESKLQEEGIPGSQYPRPFDSYFTGYLPESLRTLKLLDTKCKAGIWRQDADLAGLVKVVREGMYPSLRELTLGKMEEDAREELAAACAERRIMFSTINNCTA